LVASFLASAPLAYAQQPAPSPSPSPYTLQESIEVTTSRIPEEADKVAASLTVVTGDELRERGVSDLRGALALVAGVEIAPGGDGGPAASVPEIWGLREFDAFLLVVDGVPWGGAFNPALAPLDLHDVERIEILRGPAPVTFGATSFVGVIHVVHRSSSEQGGQLTLGGGSYGTGGLQAALRLPSWAGFDSSLSVDAGRQGFRDDRTSWQRGHLLWRNQRAFSDGLLRFDLDAAALDQQPASPHPRQGQTLTPLVPVDANHNPDGAKLDERRLALSVGYERTLGFGGWSTLASFTHSGKNLLRGFLAEVADVSPNARGYSQEIDQNDLYLDTHLQWTNSARWRAVAGFDYQHGDASAEASPFDYTIALDGSNPPPAPPAVGEDSRVRDRRDFLGLYGLVTFVPSPHWRFEAGVRLNRTSEQREEGEQAGGDAPEKRVDTRPSGAVGATFTAWERGSDHVRVFAAWRDTFKPAAIDFGVGEADQEGGRILDPETARSYQLGGRARLAGGRLALEASSFLMDFENLVIAKSVGGLPALANAGTQRFKGIDASAAWYDRSGVSLRATYGFHDSRFRDYQTEFDGVPTQLAGKYLEMAPKHQGSAALQYARAHGVLAAVEASFIGSRYLNKRNTARADSYVAVTARLGYRAERWEARIVGTNLGDARDPVAESELGDAQYYRLPSRRFDASVTLRF